MNCSSPQPRAFFPRLKCEKYPEAEVFLGFLLRHVLRHSCVHFFDISTARIGPSMVFFLSILTSKRASRHSGVHFLISHTTRWLHTHRCSDLTLRPTGATNHWKNIYFIMFRDRYTFSRTLIFFLLTLSLLTLSLLKLLSPLLLHLPISHKFA